MAAVIRIKRHLNEDPLDAILLNCKRRKTEASSDQTSEDLSAVLKFAGTVDDNNQENVLQMIKKTTKTDNEGQYKKHTPDIIAKLRQQTQLASKNNRFKVINSYRSNTPEELDEKTDVKCTILDVETEEIKDDKGSTSNNSSDARYVYDLYYTNSDDFGEADLQDLVSVYPLSEGLVYGSFRDNGYNRSDSEYSEDSNAENNWKNDYPDESDVESNKDEDSLDEDGMLKAIHRATLDGDELSSDEYDEAFFYDRDDDYDRTVSKFKSKTKSNDFCGYSSDCDEY